MKNLMIIQLLLAFLFMTSCNNCQQDINVTAESQNAFESFCEHFSKSAAFAYTKMSGRTVLLVSQETFGQDENTNLEAIEASIFALDEDGKIVALGSIRSQGTLYPVSLLDGKLMVAGHQFVNVYSIQGEMPELVLDHYAEGEGTNLTEMFKTFEKGTPIKFYRRAED